MIQLPDFEREYWQNEYCNVNSGQWGEYKNHSYCIAGNYEYGGWFLKIISNVQVRTVYFEPYGDDETELGEAYIKVHELIDSF